MSTTSELNTRFDNYVEHTQTPSSMTWDIAHNLGRLPNPVVWTDANKNIEGRIVHVNKNRLVIHFTVPYAGRAYIE